MMRTSTVEDGSDQADDGLAVGEDPHGVGASAASNERCTDDGHRKPGKATAERDGDERREEKLCERDRVDAAQRGPARKRRVDDGVPRHEPAEIGERVAPEPFRKGPDACERGQLGGEPSAADFLRNPAGEGGKERKDGAQYKKRKRRNGPGQAPVDRNGVHRPGESRHEPAESEEKTHERGSGGRRTRREDEEEADERDERHPLPAKRIKPRAKEKPHAQGAERARRFGPALPPVRRLAHAT